MRRVSMLVALAVGTLFLFPSAAAEACGDKLLSIARGIRLQQAYKARHPASILLYVGETASPATQRDRNVLIQMSLLYMSLRQAGHGVDVAETPDELEQALRKTSFDFVAVDPREIDAVMTRLAARQAAADVLPVLFRPSRSELAAAEEHFTLVLRTPATSADHLEAIDRAMRSRSHGAP